MRSRKNLFVVFVAIALAAVLLILLQERPDNTTLGTYPLETNADRKPYVRTDYPVDFIRERIAIDVYGDSVSVTGTYWFRVNTDSTGRFPIRYPFPVDEQHGYPSRVQVTGADGEPISCTHDTTLSSVHFPLDLGNPSFTVSYTQHISATNTRYILTTTAAWEQPLEYAEFTISIPEDYQLLSLSYEYDDMQSQNGRRIFSFAREQFMPVRDLVVSWMEGVE